MCTINHQWCDFSLLLVPPHFQQEQNITKPSIQGTNLWESAWRTCWKFARGKQVEPSVTVSDYHCDVHPAQPPQCSLCPLQVLRVRSNLFLRWNLGTPRGREELASVSKKFVEWIIYLHTYVTYMTYNPFMWRWFCYVRWLGLHVSILMHGTCLHHMLRVADRDGMGRTTALHQFCPGFLVGGHSFSQGGIAPLQARCSWALLEQGIEKEINRHWILMCCSI